MKKFQPIYISEDEEANLLHKRYRHTDFRISRDWSKFSRKNTVARDRKFNFLSYGVSKYQYKINSLLDEEVDYYEHIVGKPSA